MSHVFESPMPHMAGLGTQRVYQLSDATVSPVRVIGRDEIGNPIEETIPCIKHEMFVDRDGNICAVMLRNGRAAGNTAVEERYGELMRQEQIQAGSLPLAECPYTAEYRRLTNSPTLLGDIPEGVKPCDGKLDGCEHLKPVIQKRREASRARWERLQQNAEITLRMGQGIMAAVAGDAVVGPPTVKADPVVADARKRLQRSDGDQ